MIRTSKNMCPHPITAAVACALIAASYLPATWSQSGTTGQTGASGSESTLPPLPIGTLNQSRTPQFASSNSLPQVSNGFSPTVAVIGQSNVAATSTHLMSSATLSNGMQQIVLVDPARLTMVVYHVDPSKGDVQLKSVRRIDADFSLEEFNLSEPTPSTIRKNIRTP